MPDLLTFTPRPRNIKEAAAFRLFFSGGRSTIPAVQPGQLASLIDHTLLRPEATEKDVLRLCREARVHAFATVCVNPCHVQAAAAALRGTNVGICSVVGFPLGAGLPDIKAREARRVIALGATEVDMVLALGALKSGRRDLVLADIAGVAGVCRRQGALCKVILETCLLTRAEKITAARLCIEAGAHFVKTSTGFGSGGATVADVRLLAGIVAPAGLGIKAAGGIRSLADACALLAAGATRLGTSRGLQLLAEARRASRTASAA